MNFVNCDTADEQLFDNVRFNASHMLHNYSLISTIGYPSDSLTSWSFILERDGVNVLYSYGDVQPLHTGDPSRCLCKITVLSQSASTEKNRDELQQRIARLERTMVVVVDRLMQHRNQLRKLVETRTTSRPNDHCVSLSRLGQFSRQQQNLSLFWRINLIMW